MTPMQTPSKAGDLDGRGGHGMRRQWVMPYMAKGPQTAHTLSPERQGTGVSPRGLKRPQPCRQTAWS